MADDLDRATNIQRHRRRQRQPPTAATSLADISTIAQGEKLDEAHLCELKNWYEHLTQATLGLTEGFDRKKLEDFC